MNKTAVRLLAERLPTGLLLPGDDVTPPKLLALPGLSNLGISPEMAEHFAKEAGLPSGDVPTLVAEAIITLLEMDLALIPRVELEQLQARTAEINPAAPTVDIHCRCNTVDPILTIAVGRQMVIVDGPALRNQLDRTCACRS